MKNISPISISFAVLLSICASPQAQAQTEGFNVKTPVQTISDGSSEFINGIAADAKADPKTSIPRELLCRAECILALPSVQAASGRDDFEGMVSSAASKRAREISLPRYSSVSRT